MSNVLNEVPVLETFLEEPEESGDGMGYAGVGGVCRWWDGDVTSRGHGLLCWDPNK